ncbi:BQ2448_4357 [Microbotryum intermedium]|uniref:BQ2448_4357 protein n=1 Tax=Microbotryum intermedium TaxID=269621 RepID=A0A238FG72_9BASI|nr:BQ2448_4357 [Microbotryum intermedium]
MAVTNGAGGGCGDRYELVEEGGSRASDEVSDDDEFELEELAMQGTTYEASKSTRATWYDHVRDMFSGRPGIPSTHRTVPEWIKRKAESHGFFDAQARGVRTKQVACGVVLGLAVALAVQTARLSAATANEHTGVDQPMTIYVSDDFSIPLEDVYPASMVLRRPPPPFDESTIVVEEPSNAHEPAWRLSDDASRLQKCGRFVLTPLFGAGLGANVGVMLKLRSNVPVQLRAAMYAQKLGIVMLVDNNSWSYGRLDYYFEPYTIDCVPPADWYDDSKTIFIGEKGWETSPRIRVTSWDIMNMDEVDQALFFEGAKEELQRVQRVMLARIPKPRVLPASDTLPYPLIPAFEEYTHLFHAIFKPVPVILEDVERVKTMMGIGGEHPTIAVQVRLGDKIKEYKSSTRFIENTFGNLTAHLEVMHALYDRMVGCPSTQDKPCYPLSPTARRFPIDKRPRAILLTYEHNALENMARDAIAAPFEFDQTPSLNLSPDPTFVQEAFDSLPLKARVASARALVRDLILAAKETDATVVTMGSNLGRLVTLLAGSEAVLGPSASVPGGHVGGRIRALDTPWFISTYPDGTWLRVPEK